MENYEFEEEKRLKALLEEISTIDRKVLADVMSSISEERMRTVARASGDCSCTRRLSVFTEGLY